MPSQRDPRQTLKEAKQIALDHNMFVVEKSDRAGITQYLLYRSTPPNNTYGPALAGVQGGELSLTERQQS